MPAILVVDDEPQARQFITTVLSKDYEVTAAVNGKEAIERAREQSFDLAITDVYMPDVDGMETILELQRINPGVKIIAISGGGVTGDLLSYALTLGAHQTLNKPFTGSQIRSVVEQILDAD